jgi:hypothetical protein
MKMSSDITELQPIAGVENDTILMIERYGRIHITFTFAYWLSIIMVLDIDLPDGMNGLLTISSSTTFASTLMVGWSQESLTEISTAWSSEPLLDFSHLTSGTIRVSLRD